MTSLLHAGLLAATATTTKSNKSSGSSLLPLAFLAIAFLALYFLVLRPRKQRMQQQRKTQAASLDVGKAVMSVGGIMGTIVAVDDTTYDVEVAPGVVLTFVHRAVNPRPDAAGDSSAGTADEDLPPDPWDEVPPPPDEDPGGGEHPSGGGEHPSAGGGEHPSGGGRPSGATDGEDDGDHGEHGRSEGSGPGGR